MMQAPLARFVALACLAVAGCSGGGVAEGADASDAAGTDTGSAAETTAGGGDTGAAADTAGTSDAGGGMDSGPKPTSPVDCTARPAVGGSTIEVGPGRAHATIGAAVAAASVGDLVLVHAGIYREQVTVAKAVVIAAFGDGAVSVDAECTRAHGFHLSASNATVRCLGVKNTTEASVLIDGATTSNVSVEGMTLEDYNCNDAASQHFGGVAAYYSGPGMRIVGNTITRRVGRAGSVRGGEDGIWFKSNDQNASGGGHTISHNFIEGGRDGIGGENEDTLHGSFDKDTVIEHNVIKGCDDDGIQVDGGDENVIVRFNRIEGCALGVSFTPNLKGPLHIEDNVILDLVPGAYGNASCFKIGNNSTGITYLTRNECRNPLGDGIQETNPGVAAIVSRRNIIQAGRYVMEIPSAFPAGTSFDEDCLWTADAPGRFIKWAGGAQHRDLAAFRSATGFETNGRQSTDCSWLKP